MSTQYASYEETITVETYSYTATVVTEQGESTATLTARQDLDCPRRRTLKCPTCSCWHTMYYSVNLQAYEPIHCTSCCIGIYDLHFVPATVETPEPATQVVAEPQVAKVAEEMGLPIEEVAAIAAIAAQAKLDKQVERATYAAEAMLETIPVTAETVAAGIEHYKSVLAAWDEACEAEPQVVAQTVDAMIEQIDERLAKDACKAEPTYPGQCDDCPGRSHPLCCWSTEDKKPVGPDKKQYFVVWAPSLSDDKKRYGLLCRKSDGLAVDCSCGDRVHRGRKQGRCCKHQAAHNAMLQPAKKTEKAA